MIARMPSIDVGDNDRTALVVEAFADLGHVLVRSLVDRIGKPIDSKGTSTGRDVGVSDFASRDKTQAAYFVIA